MSFSVANFNADNVEDISGQSLTPSMLGPSGQGQTGSSYAILTSFAIGYESYGGERAVECKLYDQPLTSPDPNCLATSDANPQDEIGTFGEGTFARIFSFSTLVPLDVTKRYYIYFSKWQFARVIGGELYEGGAVIDTEGYENPDVTSQFEAEFEDYQP